MLKKHKKFKFYIVTLLILSMFFLVLYAVLVNTKIVYLVFIGSALVGAAILPTIPAFFELGSEIVYPIGEASATGTIMVTIRIFGFIVGLILSAVVKGESKTQS